MNIDIVLNYQSGRLAVREPFLIAEGTPVVLSFRSTYKLSECFVTFKYGEQKQSVRVKNLSEIGVPKAFVKAGELIVEVSLLINEKPIKKWVIEPIVFREGEAGFYGFSELEDIKKRLKAVEDFSANIMANVYELAATQATHSENIRDLYNSIEQ